MKALLRRLKWACQWVARPARYVIFARDAGVNTPPPLPPGMQIDRFHADDRGVLERFIRLENSAPHAALARLSDSIERGYTGYLCRMAGELVGYTWCCDALARHPQAVLLGLELGQTDAFGSDTFFAKSARKRGIPLAAMLRGLHEIRANGWQRYVAAVLTANRRSILFHRQVGFRPIAQRRVWVLLQRWILSRTGLHRYDPRWF